MRKIKRNWIVFNAVRLPNVIGRGWCQWMLWLVIDVCIQVLVLYGCVSDDRRIMSPPVSRFSSPPAAASMTILGFEFLYPICSLAGIVHVGTRFYHPVDATSVLSVL